MAPPRQIWGVWAGKGRQLRPGAIRQAAGGLSAPGTGLSCGWAPRFPVSQAPGLICSPSGPEPLTWRSGVVFFRMGSAARVRSPKVPKPVPGAQEGGRGCPDISEPPVLWPGWPPAFTRGLLAPSGALPAHLQSPPAKQGCSWTPDKGKHRGHTSVTGSGLRRQPCAGAPQAAPWRASVGSLARQGSVAITPT